MAWLTRDLSDYPNPAILLEEEKCGIGSGKVTKANLMTCASENALYPTGGGGGGTGPQVKTFA